VLLEHGELGVGLELRDQLVDFLMLRLRQLWDVDGVGHGLARRTTRAHGLQCFIAEVS